MAFENMEQAAQALAEAVSSPDTPQQSANLEAAGTGGPAPYPNQSVEPETTVGDQGDQGQQQAAQPPEAEEFTPSKDIDLSGLNDEQREFLLAREREMQSAFTRRTQELAQTRQEAEEAIQFVNELNTNPHFALQVVDHLAGQLRQAGYTPAEAQAAAQQQVSGAMQQTPQGQQNLGFEDEFEDDPYLSEINQLRADQDRLQAVLQQQQEQSRIAQNEAYLNNQAAYIQNQNPDFTDTDMARIVNMAYAYQGDLIRAADEYSAIRNDALSRWQESKGSATAPTTLASTGHAQASPEKFENIDDPRLEAAALRRLQAALES